MHRKKEKSEDQEIIDHLETDVQENLESNPIGSPYIYAGISDRIKAIFADLVVIGFFMIIIAKVFATIEDVPDSARMIAFIFVFVLYDPLFTSLFGGTIGHFMNGLRVKRADNIQKNIILPLAIVRFTIKTLLGWLSILTVSGNEKSRAIHDLICGSVVIYKQK